MRQLLLILISLILFSCGGAKEEKITIAVANNMRYAMDEIAEEFEKKNHIRVEVSSSSSGTLTTQIKQGAPFDIFVSANMRYPNILFKEGFTENSPKVYAYGSLVLWTLKDISLKDGLSALLSNDFRKIAIANPETAPYGIAALEALKNAKLDKALKSKIIWGEGVSQINQYVKSESVDAGLTSKSVLFSPKIKQKGHSVDVDKDLYSPIEQGIVMLKHGKSKNEKNAELFYKFMFSDETKTILTKFGYVVK
tara:strand:+ start:14876 stop:15631 length:756 start_codon:yes stop_codon:yes gene_type:complete